MLRTGDVICISWCRSNRVRLSDSVNATFLSRLELNRNSWLFVRVRLSVFWIVVSDENSSIRYLSEQIGLHIPLNCKLALFWQIVLWKWTAIWYISCARNCGHLDLFWVRVFAAKGSTSRPHGATHRRSPMPKVDERSLISPERSHVKFQLRRPI